MALTFLPLQGRQVFDKLKQLDSIDVKLQIAVNSPQTSTLDTEELAAAGDFNTTEHIRQGEKFKAA